MDDAAGAVEEGLGEGVDQVPRGVWGRAARGGGWSRAGGGVGQADEGGGVAAFEGAAGDAVEVGLVGESAEHGAKPVSDGLEAAVGGEGGVESVVPVGVRGVGQAIGDGAVADVLHCQGGPPAGGVGGGQGLGGEAGRVTVEEVEGAFLAAPAVGVVDVDAGQVALDDDGMILGLDQPEAVTAVGGHWAPRGGCVAESSRDGCAEMGGNFRIWHEAGAGGSR